MENIMVFTTNVTELKVNQGLPFKAILSMMPCFFFLYINAVMLFTLRSKPTFRDTSRYILFTNMLYADSLNLLICLLLYIFAVLRVYMNNITCLIVVLVGYVIFYISPLNLAVMSLERYVAICFPLRHAEIATCRRTGIAIIIIWAVGSLHSLTDLLVFAITEPSFISVWGFCSSSMLYNLEVYISISNAFTIIYFLSVGIIIIYTYVNIVVAARSVSSSRGSAAKAHKTVLLHLIQLGLCLSSILFDTINAVAYAHLDLMSILNVQYIMFLGLIIFPRCLSPLIYGLRDQMFRPIFQYYFTFGYRTTIKPINI